MSDVVSEVKRSCCPLAPLMGMGTGETSCSRVSRLNLVVGRPALKQAWQRELVVAWRPLLAVAVLLIAALFSRKIFFFFCGKEYLSRNHPFSESVPGKEVLPLGKKVTFCLKRGTFSE